MMHMYMDVTLIPKMLEIMLNGTNGAKILENYGITMLCQGTVG